MQIRWIVAMASACLLAPAMASAQSSQPPAHPSRAAVADTGRTAKAGGQASDTTASAGEVASSTERVPQAALAAQKNPKLIGSPAWWSTHATADGKPKHGS